MTTVNITVGSSRMQMTWSPGNAGAPIRLDGLDTGYQTADARHDAEQAVRLVVTQAFGPDVDWDAVEWC
jgi:hypothetical protein